jgi:hypothetical protein
MEKAGSTARLGTVTAYRRSAQDATARAMKNADPRSGAFVVRDSQ